MAGPKIIPQKPKLEIPAIIARKMRSSLIFVGVLTSFSLIHFIISGLMSVSAIKEIIMKE